MITEIKDILANRMSNIYTWLIEGNKIVEAIAKREDIKFTEIERNNALELMNSIKKMTEDFEVELKKVVQ